MITVKHSLKGTPFIWAKELHEELNITIPLKDWFIQMIDVGFTKDLDYSYIQKASDWAVNIDMVKHIAIIQKTARGKALREYLLYLDSKVKEGQLLNHQQISVLFDLCRVFGFFSVQEILEKKHFDVFEKKQEHWWEYRARILGQSTGDLKEMMRALGKKYKNQRQALLHIDKYELIKRATFDLFKAMGKNDDYAKNVAMFAKQIAIELKPEIYDDRNASINFKNSKQEATIQQLTQIEKSPKLLDKF
jgi:phage anti-repressor protein